MKKLISALAIICLTTTAMAQMDTVPKRMDTLLRPNPDTTKKDWDTTNMNHNPSAPISDNLNKNEDTNTSAGSNGAATTPATTSTEYTDNNENKAEEKTAAAEKKPATKKDLEDRIFVKGSKAFVTKSGNTKPIVKSMKLNDGSIVMANGTIKLPDGNTMKLKDGEHIKL